MIRHYLLHFFRNLQRQKLFSFINLLGLTVSMASTLLIYLYVHHEFSFDRFHKHSERIYRINQTFIYGENSDHQFASTGPGVAYSVKEEVSEVDLITSIHTPGNFIISYVTPDQEVIAFEEDRILAADTNFFSMFNFPFLKGDPASALRLANTLIMTESTAKKYFGEDNPIGKLVTLGALNGNDHTTYEVTGVVKETPDNSYIEFDVLLSMKTFPIEKLNWSWAWTQLETYLLLNKQANVDHVRAKLQTIPRKHAEQTLQRVMNTSFDEYIKSGKKWELFLQPMTSIHLPEETVLNRLNEPGNIKIIYSLISAAAFIILLSCINFMNLSTAQFTRRVKDASVRKILGLGKRELSFGYFLEALILCTIALGAALSITQILLPAFNLMTGKSLELHMFGDPSLLASLLILVLVMALFSSIYPALFLNGFHPVEALKGKIRVGREGKSFRNGLVVFQFTMSIVLIICTGIVFEQLKFVSEKSLGFDKENLLVLEHIEGLKNRQTLADAVRDVRGVMDVSWCTSLPPKVWGGDTFSAEGLNGISFPLNYTSSDEHYLSTLDIRLLVGGNFSKNNPSDANRVILNEMAIKKIGWKVDESVIGKKIQSPDGGLSWEVIGVVADFHYWSLENPIEPMAIFNIQNTVLNTGQKQFLALRIEAQNTEAWQNTLLSLNTMWKKHAGDAPFQYAFVDQTFAETFKIQNQFASVLSVMAGLAILIASLGLLGMIIYALEQRTKEIGIRKVSGATVWQILVLISKGYTRLIFIAFVIGAPVSYYLMHEWLKDFAYRIAPSLLTFALTGAGTLLIAVVITSYHSIRAALQNPANILKEE
ncbi:MAG: ABC transporter permease [Cyclobacteriaceae bacterium]